MYVVADVVEVVAYDVADVVEVVRCVRVSMSIKLNVPATMLLCSIQFCVWP